MSISRHRVIFIVIPLAAAIILRLYPYLISGVPWGTDAWPVIRNANEILANSPTSLGGNPIFDNYNIYWPGVSLFGAMASSIFGVPPISAMPIVIPLVASLMTLFFYLIAEKLTKSSLAASIASLFFATAGFDAIFTASATKETFAYPIFMLAILLLLMKPELKVITIFVFVSITLALSHHVTMIVLLAIAAGVVGTNAVLSLGGYQKVGRMWLFPLIILAVFAAYVELYAKIFFTGNVSGIDISLVGLVPLASLLFVSISVVAYFSLAAKVRSMLPEGLVILGMSFALLYLSTQTSILPFAPPLPELIAGLAVPYLIIGFFSVFGYKKMHDHLDKSSFAFSSSWLGATLALLAYTIIGTPNGVGLIYRFFTFVYGPLAIFAALFLVKVVEKKGIPGLVRRAGIALLIIALVLVSSYMSYASVVGKENLLAGHYAYSKSDYSSAQFVSSKLASNSTLAADNMIGDMYTGYFRMAVDPIQGYKYITGIDQLGTNSSEMLVTYTLMQDQGYDLNIYGVPIPSNWFHSLSNQSSLVYNNGNEMIWR